MNSWTSILNWFAPFCLGIWSAYFLSSIVSLDYLYFEITILVVCITYVYLAKKIRYLPIISASYMFLFFGLGFVGFQTNQSIESKNHFSQNNYTYFEGKIDEIQQRDSSKYVRLIVEIEKGLTEWNSTSCKGKALIYVDTNQLKSLSAGQFIFFPNTFETIQNKNNPGEFNSTLYWNNLQIYQIAFLKGYEIQRINKPVESIGFFKSCQLYFSKELEKVLSGDELAIGKAILLGEKATYQQMLKMHFQVLEQCIYFPFLGFI